MLFFLFFFLMGGGGLVEVVDFRVDSCESSSKCGSAPEITGITALDAQIKYLN